MSPKLVLFDVDGILLKLDTIKFDHWHAVVKKNFGLDVSRHDIYTSGKTDRQILFELIRNKGMKIKASDKRITEVVKDIGPTVAGAIKNQKLEKIKNVEKLIKELKKRRIAIGLLTGNTPGKAKVKLQSASLWKYFKIGAFGDSTIVRNELIPIAMKDAKEKTGITFRKKDVFLIGDTIRDIWCAKKGKVKIISVASGKETVEQLRKEKPNYLFKDFSNENIDKMIRILEK
jgi:phosphoglycolate phosphatase-like HAD superfamily hydrolase